MMSPLTAPSEYEKCKNEDYENENYITTSYVHDDGEVYFNEEDANFDDRANLEDCANLDDPCDAEFLIL